MDNSGKIILDLCGGTGAWSRPYKEAGYDVRLITLPDNDVREYQPPANVYGILAAPPCTEFSLLKVRFEKPRNLEIGMEIVIACLNIIWACQYKTSPKKTKSSLIFWALENPGRGFLKWFLGKPALTFNPYDFGDAYKKETALWGLFNPPRNSPIPMQLRAMKQFGHLRIDELPGYQECMDRNIHDKGSTCRSITPPGFANAFYEANK